MEQRGDGVDDSPADTDDDVSTAINQYLSTCDRSRRGSDEPWTEQEDWQLLHAFWLSLADPTAPLLPLIMFVSNRPRMIAATATARAILLPSVTSLRPCRRGS